jgi:hypothetical protein
VTSSWRSPTCVYRRWPDRTTSAAQLQVPPPSWEVGRAECLADWRSARARGSCTRCFCYLIAGEALVRLDDRLIRHVRPGAGDALDRVEHGGMQPGRLASRSAHPLHRTQVVAAGRGHQPRPVRGPLTERSDLMTQKICFDCFHRLFPDKPVRKVTLGRQCVVCKAQTDRTEQMIPVEAEDIPPVEQTAQVPRRVLHRTERHADRRRQCRTVAIAVFNPRRRPLPGSVPAKPGRSSVNIASLRVSGASSAVSYR